VIHFSKLLKYAFLVSLPLAASLLPFENALAQKLIEQGGTIVPASRAKQDGQSPILEQQPQQQLPAYPAQPNAYPVQPTQPTMPTRK